eukprot:g66020.t1
MTSSVHVQIYSIYTRSTLSFSSAIISACPFSAGLVRQDLARSLLSTHLSSFAQASFKLLVGFDNNLHGKHPENSGKRYHMRRIGAHLAVPSEQMLLIDDSDISLDTGGDGWHGLKVRQPGFSFGDVWEAMSLEGGGKKSGEKPQGSRSLAAGASSTLPPRVVLWAARLRLPASVSP